MDKITSRAVIGYMIRALQQDPGVAWVNLISNYFQSNQASEEYAWIGASPAMQEWIGQRKAKGFAEYDFTIKNKKFEASIEIPVRWMNRDKFNMIETRIAEMVQRAQAHWAKLLANLIVSGESAVCYDGQFYFDTDHVEGASGAQSNDISVTLANLPVTEKGITTLPSVGAMQLAIGQAIQQMSTFVDDVGEPVNETAKNFLVMVPPTFMQQALQAVATPVQVAETQTALTQLKQDFTISAVATPRLAPWTTKFAVFRTDGSVKPFIRQEEAAIDIKAKAEGSDFEFDNDAHQYGIDASRNVGFGRWQNSCLVTLA